MSMECREPAGRHNSDGCPAPVTKFGFPALHREMSDAAIIARARQGDDAAFEQLMTFYYPACLRFVRGVLDDPSEADDVLQNAFFRVYRALPRFVDDGRFKPWLFQIIVNECRMANRSLWRRVRRLVSHNDEGLAVQVSAPSRDLDASLDIGAAVAKLGPKQREILLLRFGEDMDYADIARVAGIGESAAKMRVNRACAALKELLGESTHDDR